LETNLKSRLAFVKRSPRRAIAADVTVVDGCGRELQARLWNISEGGFSAESELKMPLGATISVELPGRGKVRAQIRWVLGWRFGAMIVANEQPDRR